MYGIEIHTDRSDYTIGRCWDDELLQRWCRWGVLLVVSLNGGFPK